MNKRVPLPINCLAKKPVVSKRFGSSVSNLPSLLVNHLSAIEKLCSIALPTG
jgi:hypothetical protein